MFKYFIKDHRQISNEISDSDGTEKQYFHEVNPPSATRWHLPRPNPEIQPPNTNFVRRNDIVEENIAVDLGTSHSSNYNTSGDFSVEVSNSFSTTQSPITTTTTIPTTISIQTTTPYIKPPSRLYEPPFLYPIYNLNYTESENQNQEDDQESSTASTITISTTTVPTTTTTPLPLPPSSTSTSTTKSPFTRPAIFAGRPFAPAASVTFTSSTTTVLPTTGNYEENSDSFVKQNVDNFITKTQTEHSTSQPKAFEIQTQIPFTTSTTTEKPLPDISTPFLDLLPPNFDYIQQAQPEPFKAKQISNELAPAPAQDLLPPFQEFIVHDVATTQGPPIYYEWKIPSDGLEPPKFDSPSPSSSGIESENQTKDDIISSGSSTVTENYTTNLPFANNPFLAPILNRHHDQQKSTRSFIRSPTVRSIPKTTTTLQPPHFSTQYNTADDDNDTENTATKRNENLNNAHKEVDIQQLQKDYLIPDFLFPLENDARTGYEQSDIVNSFQLKIPDHHDDNEKKSWYGENSECPECHPSFVKPGTCEPCIRRRR